MERDDKQLITDYLAGETAAFEILIARYLKLVYNFVFRLVGSVEAADDLTQEVFFKVWRYLGRYDEQYSFKTWLYRIARNTAFDWLRKKKLVTFSQLASSNEDDDSDSQYEPIDQMPLPDELFARQELGTLLESALQQIDPLNRSIILLHHNDGLTFAEIAEVMDKPLNTVKSRYRRALLALRDYLKNAPK